MNTCYVTMDSFGSDCPANWEEIAYALNAIIDARGITAAEDHDARNQLWEDWCNGRLPEVPEARFMRRVSIDNGAHWTDPEDVIAYIKDPGTAFTWETVAEYMDDDAREATCREGSNSELEFLRRYLELAPCDLIIG